MSQRKIFNVLKRNSALRPQHQQRNKISNSKSGSTSIYKEIRNKENKHINIPIPLRIKA